MRITTAIAVLVAAPVAVSQAAENDSVQEQLQQHQQEIEQLKSENRTMKQQLNATADMVEQTASTADQQGHGGGGRTTVGGYGELHYNNRDDSTEEIDFHRFVLFFGHQFSPGIRFASELELEHALAGDGAPGEVELEQAFVEFDLPRNTTARAGLFLVPAGILNPTHEPATFYGVERNPVESAIIPTTWWEAGAGFAGEIMPGLQYDVSVTSGLQVPTAGADAYTIRDGRQKVAEATAENFAYTGRVKWTAIPGTEVASTVQYQDDITQGTSSAGGGAWLFEAHAITGYGPFNLRALVARWILEGSGPEALGRDHQMGWYIEPSYKITDKVGVFVRHNQWDTEFGSSADTEKRQTKAGVNFWPHPDVVLKADVQHQAGAIDSDGFNLGVGYQF